jgi:hypothetical protein
MKRILLPLLILFSISAVQAQITKINLPNNNNRFSNGSDLKLGLSINPGMSLGRSSTQFVLAGELSLYKSLTTNWEATFSTGYMHFFYSHDVVKEKLIPVKAGIRYFLNSRLYVGAQAGVAFSTTDGGAYFIYSPMVGWQVSKQFDLGLKYDHIGNKPSVLGLTSTYKFGL